jgi:hypothetical protein
MLLFSLGGERLCVVLGSWVELCNCYGEVGVLCQFDCAYRLVR